MKKLLWIDDEIELLKAHILFLEKKGYDVETVTNGYDALDEYIREAVLRKRSISSCWTKICRV